MENSGAELYLVSSQNFEGRYDLVRCVRVGRLAGHEVDEGLEGDGAHPVGIHNAHDAGELVLPLKAAETQDRAVKTNLQSWKTPGLWWSTCVLNIVPSSTKNKTKRILILINKLIVPK